MSDEGTVFVWLVVVWCLALLAVVHRAYRRVRLQAQRYRFFALRDEVLLLVARGDLDEQSLVYSELCLLTNGVIRHVKDLTLWRFARWYVTYAGERRAGADQAQEFFAALEQASPEVQRVAEAFFDSILDLLRENSVLLRSILGLQHIAKNVRIPGLPVYEAYRVGKDLRDLAASVAMNVRVPA